MDDILYEIKKEASNHKNIKKIILFGSRARGDNKERSDIDLAVYADGDIYGFIENLENSVRTLLEFDITDMNKKLDKNFIEQIKKEGITVYEKSWI